MQTDTTQNLSRDRRIGEVLEQALAHQLGRIRRRFLLHGLAWLAAAFALATLVYFGLDRALRLPSPVRVIHSLATLTFLVLVFRRHILYPLSRAFSRLDVALAVELRFPELRQQLVSALQLKEMLTPEGDAMLRNQSAAMISRVVDDAVAEAQRLPLGDVLDPRRTLRVWSAAGALLVLLFASAMVDTAATRAFLLRALGLNVPYPRATNLIVELPPNGPEIRRVDGGGVVELTVAGGSDLHVSVLAMGTVPREVFLNVVSSGDERQIAMTTRPGGRFRHVFRRITGEFSFHASGGDDDRGNVEVVVKTINPPLVAEIRARLTPPAYTARDPVDQVGGSIEALEGTEVDIEVRATAAVETATMVFVESGRSLELSPLTIEDDSGRSQVYSGKFAIAESDRYQVELVGDTGLRNPHPGTFAIVAQPDYAPVGRLLKPADDGLGQLLPTGVLALRVHGRDDYGLTAGTLRIDVGAEDDMIERSLLAPEATAATITEVVVTDLFELAQLLGGRAVGPEGIHVEVELTDNRAPEPLLTALPRRQIQIVDEGQLSAAIGRHFRGIREEVERAGALQRDRKDRLEEVIETIESAGINPRIRATLTAVEVGQSRLLGIAETAHRRLMQAFDVHLFNRMEGDSPPAEQLLAIYLQWHRANPDPAPFAPEFYRHVLAERRAGKLAAMERSLDPILAMVAVADRLAHDRAAAAVRQITRAQVAADPAEMTETARQIVELQGHMVDDWQELLDRLDEWNDFQDVIQETRVLRDRQRDVQTRTDELRGKR